MTGAPVVRDFIYKALPCRVVFGTGALSRIGSEVELLGASRVVVLCTPRQRSLAQRVAALLGKHCVGIFDEAAMHVPSEVANAGHGEARKLGADCLLSIGGGS